MNVEYTGRNTVVGPREKKLAATELERINGILLGKIVSAHVILTEEKYRQIAEVTLMVATESLVARCEGTEMQQALHEALRKLEQQVVKHKERKITVERQAKPNSTEPLIEVPSTGITG
jgi:putative sigma-54 modulation protein